jgi:UDP-2,3-diacylglucosamine hydrolase
MSTLFISDIHLSDQRPDKLRLFERLLLGPARSAEALYILGDLFELWLGDDDRTPPHPQVLAWIREVRSNGVPVYFMRGNRDVLAGSSFAKMTGSTLLNDPTLIDLYGEQTLLMHGDTLCTRDIGYQRFRRLAHHPWVQRVFLSLPFWLRARIGKGLRTNSIATTPLKPPEIVDVDEVAVDQAFNAYGVRRLIHGHTHRPGVHEHRSDAGPARRTVLPDWYAGDGVLVCDPDGLQRMLRVAEYLEESAGGTS